MSEKMTKPIHQALEIIGKRWAVLIVRDLLSGKKRFSELQRSLRGVSPKILSQRLDELESWGIVTRKAYPEVPVRVEYCLTDKGADLRPVLDSMTDWSQKWLNDSLVTDGRSTSFAAR